MEKELLLHCHSKVHPSCFGKRDFFDHIDLEYARSFTHAISMRHKFTEEFAWAIPSEEAIRKIVKFSPIIEIGAGKGLWARLIQSAGADIIAFDNFSWDKDQPVYFDVQKGTASKAKLYPERTLFLCWPPYDESMALKALVSYHKAGGRKLVYIGEGHGGCTGCDKFHEYLYHHFDEIDGMGIPQWPGIHDRMTIYKRKKV